MPQLDEKIPADFVPVLTRRERIERWFVPAGEARWVWRVRWVRLIGAFAVAALAAYLLLATAIFCFARWNRGLDAVGWTDVAWPPHWPRYREARGEKFHVEAKQYFEQGMWREALVFSRNGVMLAPANRDGRLRLVQLLIAARRPLVARQTLLDGMLFHRDDPVYLRAVHQYLLQAQEDFHVIAIARRGLAEQPRDAEGARVNALAAATAYFLRGNFDEAEDVLRLVPGVAEARASRLLRAKIEWERGYREVALAKLRQLEHEFPADAETNQLVVEKLRQSGRRDEARRATLAFQIAHPGLPGPRISLLYAYKEAGDAQRIRREAAAFLREFPGDESALWLLADFAAHHGDADLAKEISRRATGGQMRGETFALAEVEALLVAGDYRGALERTTQLRADHSLGAADRALLDCLLAIAHCGLGDEPAAMTFLTHFLAQPNLRAEPLLLIANRFVSLGKIDAARQILSRAVDADPRNQPALTRLVELELDVAAVDSIPAHLQRLLVMRRPPLDLLRVAQIRLGSDRYLFSAESGAVLDSLPALLQARQ